MADKDALKECPWCGSSDVAHGLFDGRMCVRCVRCDACGPSFAEPPEGAPMQPVIEKSRTAWNTRASPPPAARAGAPRILVEAAAELLRSHGLPGLGCPCAGCGIARGVLDMDAALRWINRKRGPVYRSKWWQVCRRVGEWWRYHIDGQA